MEAPDSIDQSRNTSDAVSFQRFIHLCQFIVQPNVFAFPVEVDDRLIRENNCVRGTRLLKQHFIGFLIMAKFQFPILSLPSELIVMIYDYIGPIERLAMRKFHPKLAEMELNSKYSMEELEILLVIFFNIIERPR